MAIVQRDEKTGKWAGIPSDSIDSVDELDGDSVIVTTKAGKSYQFKGKVHDFTPQP